MSANINIRSPKVRVYHIIDLINVLTYKSLLPKHAEAIAIYTLLAKVCETTHVGGPVDFTRYNGCVYLARFLAICNCLDVEILFHRGRQHVSVQPCRKSHTLLTLS